MGLHPQIADADQPLAFQPLIRHPGLCCGRGSHSLVGLVDHQTQQTWAPSIPTVVACITNSPSLSIDRNHSFNRAHQMPSGAGSPFHSFGTREAVNMSTSIACKQCGAVLLEGEELLGFNDGIRARLFPCKHCGGESPAISVTVSESMRVMDSVQYKTCRPGMKKPLHDGREGADLHRDSGEWRQVSRSIDRSCTVHPEPWYEERVVDAEGKVVREISEPLRDHQGRGHAKKR